jgi:hypothetical protein
MQDVIDFITIGRRLAHLNGARVAERNEGANPRLPARSAWWIE